MHLLYKRLFGSGFTCWTLEVITWAVQYTMTPQMRCQYLAITAKCRNLLSEDRR